MISLSLHEVAAAVAGVLHGTDAVFTGVSTDTRTLAAGELFVALKGEHFDGHDSLAQAVQRGALGAIIARDIAPGIPCIRVADPRRALGLLARTWRLRHQIPIIGVTGSNGKTTTKEMIAAILRQRGSVLATKGNLNNDIGVPLTLFQLDASQRTAVIEMGASGLHDIADLAAIALPTVGVVTMCGPAHLQGFGSLENVATAKGEIFRNLGAAGVAVVNADDRFRDYWREMANGSAIVTFGIDQIADYRAESIVLGTPGSGVTFDLQCPLGRLHVASPFDGRHNVYNALAAAAASVVAGATLAQVGSGLQSVTPVSGRLNTKVGVSGCVIIDDTYNANPVSLAAALAVLAQCEQRRWLVLGDMAELGAEELSQHREAGALARRLGVEKLFTVGELAKHANATFGPAAEHYASRDDLVQALRQRLTTGVAVLVKGSRVMQLDKLVAGLATPEDTAC
jgi:UDP-N-acetylmuramoyl-tripeptide--D-alanyl-D-alanine ligase